MTRAGGGGTRGKARAGGAGARRRKAGAKADGVRLEVFHHLFAACAEEMGAALMRSAFSANIKERRDFSCALFDAEARMIAQAAHLPVHLGSAPLCVRAAIDACAPGGMRPGDAVVLNDPFQGGTHLPDVTLVSPVFLRGSQRPDFYCANRAHHADIGGAHPGSMAPVDDVHGEGLRLPPVHLVRAGELDRDLVRVVLANVRVPAEREGDLMAQVSANTIGVRRFESLEREHGAAELRARAAGLMDWTESLTRAFLAGLPDGEASFTDELEWPSAAGLRDGRTRDCRIVVRLEKRGEQLTVDLGATDPQVAGPVNTTRAVAVSAVFYVLRLFLPDEAPSNDGVLRPVEIVTRPGSLVDARYPAPVAAGNVETSQRLVDALLGAFAGFLPTRIPAASAGTMSNLTLGSDTAHEGTPFAYYETLPGGAGGGPDGPGLSGVQTHMTNTRNTPIEAFERDLPVRVLACTVRRGSGGAGRSAGGDGVLKRLTLLAPARVSWIAERQRRGPWGRLGGAAGEPGAARWRRARGAAAQPLAGKSTARLPEGAVLELETPGGGGFGPPRR